MRGSARADRLVSDLQRPGRIAVRRRPRRLTWCDRGAMIGDGGLDPMRAQLSDVAGIIPVTVVMVAQRSEVEIGSRVSDGCREREKQHDREDTSHDPMHLRIIARGHTGEPMIHAERRPVTPRAFDSLPRRSLGCRLWERPVSIPVSTLRSPAAAPPASSARRPRAAQTSSAAAIRSLASAIRISGRVRRSTSGGIAVPSSDGW